MRWAAVAVVLALSGCGPGDCRVCPDAVQDVFEGAPRCSCNGAGLVFEPADEDTAECDAQRERWAKDWAPLYCH